MTATVVIAEAAEATVVVARPRRATASGRVGSVPSVATVGPEAAQVTLPAIPGPPGPPGPPGADGADGATGPPGPGVDIATTDARYVNVDGDTMTGTLQTQAHLIAPAGQVVSSTFGNINWSPTDVTVWASHRVKLQAEGASGPTLILNSDGTATVTVDPKTALDLVTKRYADTKATILVGSIPPTPAVGVDGGFYLDGVAHILYGPKSEAAKGLPVSAMATKTPPQLLGGGYCFGQQFSFPSAGDILALRFYRGSGNATSARNLKLWTNAGVLLAAVVTAEVPGSGGWFQAELTTPVHVAAAQGVTVAYDVQPGDQYPYDPTLGSSDNPAISLGAGSYSAAGAYGTFPATTRAANHFADLVFEPPGEVWPVALKGAP